MSVHEQFTSTFCELRHNGKSQSKIFFCKLHCSYVASGGLLVYWIIPYGGHQLLHIIVNITTTAIIVIIDILLLFSSSESCIHIKLWQEQQERNESIFAFSIDFF